MIEFKIWPALVACAPRNKLCRSFILITLFADHAANSSAATANDQVVEIASLAELEQAAGQHGQRIKMKPGVYRFTEYRTKQQWAERGKQGEFQFLTFRGDKNDFDLNGVTFEVDTELRASVRAPMHTDEILVSGNENIIRGLNIQHVGQRASLGGAALGITGKKNVLRGCTLTVRGSFPYGYGDLFGKGGPNIIGPMKKSGVHIAGDGTKLVDCRLFMHAFGHGYYVQQDAADVRLENCLVEGVMRPTDEMLAETSGPAFKAEFRTVVKTRDGKGTIMPGYTKSLSEDGFRTYGQHKNLVLKNCVSKHMRSGFELRSKSGVLVEGCAAIGNERGFWVADDAVVRDCRGDAQFGPLLFVEGKNARVDLQLLPTESESTVHALATIHGTQHHIHIKPAAEGGRQRAVPIYLGYSQPMMGDSMAPIPPRKAEHILLKNETSMPILISEAARGIEIQTTGPIAENHGQAIKITHLQGD